MIYIPLAKLAEGDEKFLEAYESSGLPNKKHEKLGKRRQYSKWLRKKGLAYEVSHR